MDFTSTFVGKYDLLLGGGIFMALGLNRRSTDLHVIGTLHYGMHKYMEILKQL